MKMVALGVLSILSFSVQAFKTDYINFDVLSLSGQLYSVEGMQDAYFNDYYESGEGFHSEAKWIEYSQYNIDDVSTQLILRMSPGRFYSVNELTEKLFLDVGFSFDTISLNLGSQIQLSVKENFKMNFVPQLGLFSYNKEVGFMPYWNEGHAINIYDNVAFDGGEGLHVSASTFIARASLEIEIHKILVQLGVQKGFGGNFSVSLKDPENGSFNMEGLIHSNTCTGESSVNLYCTDYFDPFENAKVNIDGIYLSAGLKI